jgi:hypothetical protein
MVWLDTHMPALGIPTGAYIVDVIVDLGSNKKGAYETILVILAQGQHPVPPYFLSFQYCQNSRMIVPLLYQ